MSLNARTKWAAFALLALVLALSLALASSAWAAPTEPIMGVDELRSKLDASPLDGLERHHMAGYFRTVVSGSTITTIPVEVLGITGDENTASALILFEAYGPLIERYGGIVSGMSGSPVFVDDGGNAKLVGALSYGDVFTIGGTGLATPIEAMSKLEDKYTPQVEPFAEPILTSSGMIDRVIIAPNGAGYADEAANGALVAEPLATFFVGGVPARSKVFSAFKDEMAAHGIGVISQGAAPTPPIGDTSFETPLVGGASVAALMSRGDLWTGSVGTVTYANDDAVLAYGHPANWDGATSMYMTNAWVDGIWPSLAEPYKIARPTAVRGEITQDRGAGILGKLDQFPAETPITADVTNTDTGESTTTSVWVPSKLLDSSDAYTRLVALAVYPAADRLLDVWDTAGSAYTTTTVEVSDGTHTYTIVQPNVIDDSGYLLDEITYGPYDAVEALQSVLEAGVEDLHIVSVDFEARVSQHRNNATILSVDVPGGIKTGVNHAQVKLLAFGHATTQTVSVDFTLPAGVSNRGVLSATSAEESYGGYDEEESGSGVSARPTISDIAEALNEQQPNNVISVTFQPSPMSSSDDEDEDEEGSIVVTETPPTDPKPIAVEAVTTWAVTGSAQAGTPSIIMRPLQSMVGYNGSTTILGYILGPDVVREVRVYGSSAGSPEAYLGKAKVLYSDMASGPMFSFSKGGLKSNTVLRVEIDASSDGEWTSASAAAMIRVRAKVAIAASSKRFAAGKRITLTSAVLPATTAGGVVSFQEWSASRRSWRTITSAKVVGYGSGARAVVKWRPGRGTHKIRAHFKGSGTSAAGDSAPIYIYVR